MHERVSPGGDSRLVVVFLSREEGKGMRFELNASVYCISNIPESDSENPDGGLAVAGFFAANPDTDSTTDVRTARFFAGQSDPNDSSRFAIRYELDGSAGTIDGQLLDHDRIGLAVRDGPALLPGRSWTIEPQRA